MPAEYSDNGGGRMSMQPNGGNGPDARSQSFHSGRGNTGGMMGSNGNARSIMDAKKQRKEY